MEILAFESIWWIIWKIIFKVEIISADIIQIPWEETNKLTNEHFEDEDSKAQHNNNVMVEKMSDIDILLYTCENVITVNEEQQQLSHVFKLMDEINQEITELDDKLMRDIWLRDVDDKVFCQ